MSASDNVGAIAATVIRTPGESVLAIKITQISHGPKGAAGLQGVAGGSGHSASAGEDVGGHRVVMISAIGVVVADALTVSHAGRVIGVTTGAVVSGDPANFQSSGEMTEVSWNWTPDEDIWLGANGTLTQTIPPSAAFAQRVGYAIDATRMWVELSEPIIF
jgi:hypothetical protein